MFLVWIIFNGAITIEIVLFGLAVSAAMYTFICKFMNYSIHKDIAYGRRGFYILQYVCVLVWEIIKANFAVIRLVTSSRYDLEPALIRFKTDLKTKQARVILALSAVAVGPYFIEENGAGSYDQQEIKTESPRHAHRGSQEMIRKDGSKYGNIHEFGYSL